MERVLEHAEVDLKLLRYLWHHRLLPGARMTMIETVEGADMVTVLRDGREVSLGIRAASKIQVKPV